MQKINYKYATVLVSYKRKDEEKLHHEYLSRILAWNKDHFTMKDMYAIQFLITSKDFLEANKYKEEDFEIFNVNLQSISDLGYMTEEEFHADN